MFEHSSFDRIKEHFDAFWNLDYLERCNLSITVRDEKADYKSPYDGEDISNEERFTNPDIVYNHFLAVMKNHLFFGEAFPTYYADIGTAAHCAYFGSKANYTADSVWFTPCLDEPDASKLHFDIDNCPELDKQLSFVSALCEKSMGEYMIGMNGNCGIVDALAEIRGNDTLLMDLILNPEFVEQALDVITRAWIKTQDLFFPINKKNNGGGSAHGWMKTWHPGRHTQIQCDFSVMISPDFFERFVLPELTATSEYLDATLYHLDGQEQLRHLDHLLSIKSIDAIQWTAVAGQPPTSHFIEAHQKIQKAGKRLILTPEVAELPLILENLSHKGLHLILNDVKDVETAQDIIKFAEKTAH